MTAKEIRELTGLTRAEFCRRYHIPVRTVENWDAGKTHAPEWVLMLLERVVRIDMEHIRHLPSAQPEKRTENARKTHACDLISRQAGIDEIRRCRFVVDAIEKINGLPSAQQWIPCSERYPEQDDRVLVITDSYDYFVWDCMSDRRSDSYFWEDESGYYHDKYEVMAWMPLPEPWKGKS